MKRVFKVSAFALALGSLLLAVAPNSDASLGPTEPVVLACKANGAICQNADECCSKYCGAWNCHGGQKSCCA